ncbi:hypothetical protein METBIDRAFT_21150, partial [Metschnikowia bicuspidata var. bicuspidata NRRL YB-4993]
MIISKRSHLHKVEQEKHLLPLIDEICGSEPAQLAHTLAAHSTWELPPGNLLHWVRVLNLFDDILETQIAAQGWAGAAPRLQQAPPDAAALVVACLRFSKMLLDHCTNRSVYASLERVFQLVCCPDLDVRIAALDVAVCLGERYVHGSQHKKFMAPRPVRLRLLEAARLFPPAVPASFLRERREHAAQRAPRAAAHAKADHYGWADALDPAQEYPALWKALRLEYFRLPAGAAPGDGVAVFALSEEHVRKMSVQQMYDRGAESVPPSAWFRLLAAALAAKAFNSQTHDAMQLRRKLLRAKCLAIACVACFCSADFTACQLFELEPYTLGFLMDVVAPRHAALVPGDLLLAALQTLRAISMKRVWGSELVRHLGGSASHGLLYEVLRHIVRLARLPAEPAHAAGHRVFLAAVGDLVELKTLAPRLVAGGLLPELAAFLAVRGDNRWAPAAAVHVLTALLAALPELVPAFADCNGFALVVAALNHEVDFAIAHPGHAGGAPRHVPVLHSISLPQVKYLRGLLDFVATLVQSDAGDRLRNLFDSPLLAGFAKIIAHPRVFGPAVLAATVDDVSQIIHNEPTAFSILNEAGLVSAILDNYDSLFMPCGDLLAPLLEVLGAISLNKEGMTKIFESDVLHIFFRSFYDLELAKDSMRADVCTNIGCSMDELGRHNPPLRPLIMKEIRALVSDFAAYANGELLSIQFYASDSGHMYQLPTENVALQEDGQQEIESWEGMAATNLIDNVSGFLNGLLQDTGQWGKDVIREIPFSCWESFFTMPSTPFDFTVSNGVLNLIAVLKYLDDEVPSYGFLQVLESLSQRLSSQRMTQFLQNRETKSYFLDLGNHPEEATMLVKELNIVNNLLFVLTEIYLNPNLISNETYLVMLDFLQKDSGFVEKLVSVLQAAILEETNIRSALPDEVMEKTSPSIFYSIKTTAVRILPREPPSENQNIDDCTSAKFKNTLQLRFLMDLLLNNACVTLSCISRSCMHRRQDFFTDAWRRTSVVATRQLASNLSNILKDRRGLATENYLEYILRVVHVISFISTYKDRGKETLSTSFVLFFYHTTDLGMQVFDNAVSVFESLCTLPVHTLKDAQELLFIQNTPASIGFNALNLLLSFISRLVSYTHLNKCPMGNYFFNKEYCSNENHVVNGCITQSGVQAIRLLTQILGTESTFCKQNDYSLISAFPAKIPDMLVNIARLAWAFDPFEGFYPLREDWMATAFSEVKFLEQFLDMSTEVACLLLAHSGSIRNIDSLSEKASNLDLPNWTSSREKLKRLNFDELFKYEPVPTDSVRIISEARQREEFQIYSVALIQLSSFTKGLEKTVASAYQKRGIDSKIVKSVFEVIEAVSQKTEDLENKQATNLIFLLEILICCEPYVVESKASEKHYAYQATFEKFLDKFLIDVKNKPEIADTDFFAAGLSFMLPILSQTWPTIYQELRPHFPDLKAPKALKDSISDAILRLQPVKNVKSATLLGRYMYLLAKQEDYKQKVIESPLLACLIKGTKNFLEFTDKDNHKVLQDSLILVIRTCFENKSLLRNVFTAEITKSMKKNAGRKRELTQVIHDSRPLIGRDPEYFLEVASDMVRLENYDGRPSSGEKVYLVSDKDLDKKKIESPHSEVEIKVSKETEVAINPLGLVYILLTQLMSVAKEDWYSSPETDNKDEVSKKPEKKKDELEFDFLMENKKFGYMCFLLQSLCELVGSYNGAKLEFITFSKKAKNEEINKPRLTSLNFFIHQLIPSQLLVSLSGPEFHRREAISSLAKLTLLALVSTTIQENDAEPDPRKEDADMAIVRKLMVDIISKILKETIVESTNVTRVYSKIYDIFDLCSCLLSAKFRELCYPLLSKSATKCDQFYVASAFIDSHLANQITSVMSNIDLNFPDVHKVLNVGLKALAGLAKIKLANVDLFETLLPGEKEDEDIDEDEDRDETPDLFRNSTLGMYDLDVESEEEDEFYQDQSLVPMSGSDISEDDSDISDEMSYSDMDSGMDEEIVEEDGDDDRPRGYEGFDSDDGDNENHITYIGDLDIHSADGSDLDNAEASDFNGFDSDVDISGDEGEDHEEDDEFNEDEDFFDDEEMDYTEAELDDWEEAFADFPGLTDSNERTRFGDSTGDEDDEATRFDFDSEANSDSELDDEASPNAMRNHARTTRESVASLFNAIRPMGQPILSLNPSGILAGTIQIGSTRSNETAFPQLDAAFQALLNTEHLKNSIDHMLIRSSVERWAGAFTCYFRRFETAFLDTARSHLKQSISTESLEIFKKKAEEREKLRKRRQEALDKKREEARIKREGEAREREAAQVATEISTREPLMIWIGNREVDISGTDIDPEYFEALPEDIREEVFTQHIRERRANANTAGGEVREIDPDFLQALPDQIRAEILQQESMSRSFNSDGFGLFPDESDMDSEMGDELEMDDDLGVSLGEPRTEGTENVESDHDEVSKMKKKSFTVPL